MNVLRICVLLLLFSSLVDGSQFEEKLSSKNEETSKLINYLKGLDGHQDIDALVKKIDSFIKPRKLKRIPSSRLSYHYDAGGFVPQLRLYFVGNYIDNGEGQWYRVLSCEVYLRNDDSGYVEYSFGIDSE